MPRAALPGGAEKRQSCFAAPAEVIALVSGELSPSSREFVESVDDFRCSATTPGARTVKHFRLKIKIVAPLLCRIGGIEGIASTSGPGPPNTEANVPQQRSAMEQHSSQIRQLGKLRGSEVDPQ
jgi:hypothetical protein